MYILALGCNYLPLVIQHQVCSSNTLILTLFGTSWLFIALDKVDVAQPIKPWLIGPFCDLVLRNV